MIKIKVQQLANRHVNFLPCKLPYSHTDSGKAKGHMSEGWKKTQWITENASPFYYGFQA